MAVVVLTSKGQMTLPKEIRDDLGVGPGDRLEFTKHGDGYLLSPRRSAKDLFAKYRRADRKPLSAEQMNDAIAEEVWERNRPQHDRS